MTMQTTRPAARLTRASVIGSHIFIVAVFGAAALHAQKQPGATALSGAAATAAAAGSAAAAVVPAVDVEGAAPDAVRLLVGRSTLVDVGAPIARVSLTSSDIADALVTSPSQLLVHGKGPGAISMFVWSRGGAVRRFEVSVQRDLSRLNEQVKQLFPKENIEVRSNGRSVVLAGSVSSKDVVDRAINVALGFVEKREDVVTLLLKVRFAEVSRQALTEFGMSFFTSPTGIKNTLGRVTTEQFAAPNFSDLAWTKAGSNFGSPVTSAEGKFAVSDFLNLFLLSEKYDLGTVIRAMQQRGVFQSLAEPNLVAESGKEASFLAGGEFPIPVVQGSANGSAVSIQFKEFGVRLNFTPTVIGNRVHLKVKPEVSTLDYANGVSLQGFRIPALSTRRTETELELRDGQTFAIAGLMNNQMSTTMQKVPGLGDIPILGQLFKSRAAQKSQSELVVMITPIILPTDSDGVTSSLPRLVEPFIAPLPENRTKPAPPEAFGPDRRSSISAPVPSKAAEDDRKAQERAAQLERDRIASEARAQADAARVKTAEDQRASAAAAKVAERDAAKTAEAQKIQRAVDAKRQATDAKQQAKDAEAAARRQKSDEKTARERAKKDQEAAARAAKEGGPQASQTDGAAAAAVDPQTSAAMAEARARALAVAAQVRPSPVPSPASAP
jgi:pilus assembly protein CpaC